MKDETKKIASKSRNSKTPFLSSNKTRKIVKIKVKPQMETRNDEEITTATILQNKKGLITGPAYTEDYLMLGKVTGEDFGKTISSEDQNKRKYLKD